MDQFETINGVSHAHRPLVWGCVCFSLGIIINEYFKIPFIVLFFVTALWMFMGLLARRGKWFGIFLLLSIICLGAVYAGSFQHLPKDHISRISYGYRQEPVLG